MLLKWFFMIVVCSTQALAGSYRVTVEYSLPPFDAVGSFQTEGSGIFADSGTGQPTLTISFNDTNIVYFGGLISGSFNNINVSYTGTTGQMTGDWDVPNAFNPATIGPVIIPLAGGAVGPPILQAADQSDALVRGPIL